MKPGDVVRIRVNPRDSMSVADLVNKIGFNYTGMSFSQACAIALSSLLETMRSAGHLPERDGFEYDELMKPFGLRQRTARKHAITKTFGNIGPEFKVPAIPTTQEPQLEVTADQLRANRRINELAVKRASGEVFSAEDEAEWAMLLTVASGDFTMEQALALQTNPPTVVDTLANSR